MSKYFLLLAIFSLSLLAISSCKEETKGEELTQQKVKTRIISPKNGALISKGDALKSTGTLAIPNLSIDSGPSQKVYASFSLPHHSDEGNTVLNIHA